MADPKLCNFVLVLLLVASCFVLRCSKPSYTPPPEEDIEVPKTMELSDEEFETFSADIAKRRSNAFSRRIQRETLIS